MNMDKLTKDDLIKVIANMHDTIQDWDQGYGLSDDDSNILCKIGSACVKICVNNQDWQIDKDKLN